MRRLIRWAALLLAWSGACTGASGAGPQPAARQPEAAGAFVFLMPPSARVVAAQCAAMLADLALAESRLASQEQPSAAQFFDQLDAITRREEDTLGPLGVLAAVSPRKSIRDASDACERDHDAWSARFLQNAAVYARLQQPVPDDEIDRRFQREALDAFEDAGVALPVDRQNRVREVHEQITQLSQTFERRLREDRTELPFSRAELAGVPAPKNAHASGDRPGSLAKGPVVARCARGCAESDTWAMIHA